MQRPVVTPTPLERLAGIGSIVFKTDRFWLQHLSVEEHLEAYHEIWKAEGVLKGAK